MISKFEDLFQRLLSSTKPSEVKQILVDLGDSADISVDEEFGNFGFVWRFYSDNDSNLSTINIATKPERSLVERITNAIDAVLEREHHKRPGDNPSSPMEAAKNWFGRPPSSEESGIFTWKDYRVDDHDRHVHVLLLDGDEDEYPTIDILDDGIGIKGEDFPETILSLHRGNKLKKKYLAGAFGQGGASSLAFCDYTLILSRHVDDPEIVSFTVIKLLKLSDDWKEDAYAYLTIKTDSGYEVPSVSEKGSLKLYEDFDTKGIRDIEHDNGTLVRSYGYSLERYNKTLSSSPGNLYHLLHYLLFDPLLPFRLIDIRSANTNKDELVTGARNRLMKLVLEDENDDDVGNTQLKHYSPIEMVSPLSEYDPSLAVEYWVVFNYRKVSGKEDKVLRSFSTDIFIDKSRPILGSLNGQNQGELTSWLIRDVGLSMLSRHLIVHIDASKAGKEIRKNLLSSTREGFKDDKVLSETVKVIRNRLEDDEALTQLERELEDQVLLKKTSDVDDEVKKEISKLLSISGYEVSVPGPFGGVGEGDEEVPQVQTPHPTPKPLDPIETLDYPDVSYLNIVYPRETLHIPIGETRILRVETDANYKYDRLEKIGIHFDGKDLEFASKTNLKHGRMKWRVRTSAEAVVGEIGEIIISLTKPSGEQIAANVYYEIMPPRESKPTGKGKVPPFEIIPLNPEDPEDKESFDSIWPDAQGEEISHYAYAAKEVMGEVLVYYSTGFMPYRAQIEKLKDKRSLGDLFIQNYKIWIGYHAILQHQSYKEDNAAGSLTEDIRFSENQGDKERSLVAEMQVKQAFRTAEIQLKSIRAEKTA